MARAKGPEREKARVLYIKSLGKKKLVDIAEELGLTPSKVRKWKSLDKWDDELNGTLHYSKGNAPLEKRKKGGQPGNKNAYGENKVKGVKGGDRGEKRALKHGAYANVYLDHLSDGDREIYESLSDELNLEAEIKIVKLKITRLLNREESFFYNQFGKKIKKEISEEDRENGIIVCMDQLRRLTDTQARINNDVEKFAFDKYKFEVETQLKREKIEIQKRKLGEEDEGQEDDGFLEALQSSVKDVWADEE